jgi:cobalt-zinc-cadmium efflux system membrane fusion protein
MTDAADHPRLRSTPHVHGTRPNWLRASIRGLSLISILTCLGLAWWWLATHHFTDDSREEATARAPQSVPPTEQVTVPENLTINLTTAEVRPLGDELTVPGRLDYDARRQVDYLAPVDGIATAVEVSVRQTVSAGDVLAELSSREVGMARDMVRKCEADQQIAADVAEWATMVASNVTAILAFLEPHPPLDQVQDAFAKRALGENWELILGAYSALLHAEKVNAGTKSLVEGGLLSGRIVDERQANLEAAWARFRAVCEEAQFDTAQAKKQADSGLQQAERQLEIAREHLRALVGSSSPQQQAEAERRRPGHANDTLSTLDLRSPIAGVVEEVFLARGERVTSGQRLFLVADTSTLWVRAQIHERQWASVRVTPGEEVKVIIPGLETREATARVNHVGSVVEAESRSVPLVAVLANADGRYKPGMFVWVEVSQGEVKERLVVPAEAVMRHEGRAFVFVPTGSGSFARRDIRTGIETKQFVEVVEGLAVGDQIAGEGVFVLKSRLLIEQAGGE